MTSGGRPPGTSPGIRVSVAIPTRCRPACLGRAIASILDGTRLPEEIVVTDQGEAGETAALLEALRSRAGRDRIRHLEVAGQGVGLNRNRAVAAARGDFIAFCDDDMIVHERWLEAMVETWTECWSAGDVVLTGPILPGGDVVSAEGVRELPGPRVHRSIPWRDDVLYGGHFGAPRTVFERLGPFPFDERLGPGAPFHGAEDEEFAWRALESGIPVAYEPSILAWHHPELAPWRRTAYLHAVGNGAMLAQRLLAGKGDAPGRAVVAVAVQIAKAGRAAFHRDDREAVSRLLFGAGIVTGFARWLGRAALGRIPPRGTPA